MQPRKSFSTFFAFFSLLVVSLVIVGYYLIDSPQVMQLRKIDQQRVLHLKKIILAVDNFYKKETVLPRSLSMIQHGDSLHLKDPVTGVPYMYGIINADTFEVCAAFVTSSNEYGRQDSVYVAGVDYYLGHDRGLACFEVNARRKDAD